MVDAVFLWDEGADISSGTGSTSNDALLGLLEGSSSTFGVVSFFFSSGFPVSLGSSGMLGRAVSAIGEKLSSSSAMSLNSDTATESRSSGLSLKVWLVAWGDLRASRGSGWMLAAMTGGSLNGA